MTNPILTLQKVVLEENESFKFLEGSFSIPWHYHPQVEITLIEYGEGVRYIGDNIKPFVAPDLVLIGSQLPHVWKIDPQFRQQNSQKPKSKVILFDAEFWGEKMLLLPEMKEIQFLLQQAERGIEFDKRTIIQLIPLFETIKNAINSERLILLLQILNIMAKSLKDKRLYSFLASKGYRNKSTQIETDKLSKTLDFIADNFHRTINLSDLAKNVHLSEGAFSRYFKQRTEKSPMNFINEFRIGHIKRNLIETTETIDKIYKNAGFKSQTNFNKQFLKIVGCSPTDFRKEHLKKS